MKPFARILMLLLLVLGAFAGIDYFLMDRVMLTRLANVISPPPSTIRAMAEKSAGLLEDLYSDSESPYAFENNRWSLRKVRVTGDYLQVIVDYPVDRSATPAVYSEVKRHCPIAEPGSYWDHDFAQPFTIYVSDVGENGVRALARCDRTFDWSSYEQVTGQADTDITDRILPREGEDADALTAAASKGEPSFNTVADMVRRNQLRDLEISLMERPELVRLYDRSGQTLLYFAQTPAAVRTLIGYGADPNVRTRNGEITPLQWMIQTGGSLSTLKAMVWDGADTGSTMPESAPHAEYAEFLLDRGAPITENALFEALKAGRLDVAEVLYQRGADINATTLASPLHYFAATTRANHRSSSTSPEEQVAKNVEIFRLAHSYGADTGRRDNGRTIREYLEAEPDWPGRDELLAIVR